MDSKTTPPFEDGGYELIELSEPGAAAVPSTPAPAPSVPTAAFAPAAGVPAPSASAAAFAPAASVPAGGPAAKAKPGWFGRFLEGFGPLGAKGAASTGGPAGVASEAKGPRLRPRRRPARTLHLSVPSWAVSVMVHAGVLSALGLASMSSEVGKAVASINAAMVDTALGAKQAEELTPILADPTNQPRDLATGLIEASTPGLGGGLGTGSGPPSATPRVTAVGAVSARSHLPSTVSIGGALTSLALKPPSSVLTREIGGGVGGLVAGDVARPTEGIGEALDQIAREILRLLERSRVTVVWMFDESGSMRDDQRAIRDKFRRVATELRAHIGDDKKARNALTHAVIGFGEQLHFDIEKPTTDLELVAKAIERLRVDETGTENTCEAVIAAANRYGRLTDKDHRVMIVLATDESGDDGLEYLEVARSAAVRASIPIYVIGRQAMFGKTGVVLPFKDTLTGDTYYPTIRRGPESADFECLQWDGLHPRWDEQPSGFAPYELARLTKETGGIYFLLPSEESLRSTQREKAYSMETLKEYVPDYVGRALYNERARKSPFRFALLKIINDTKGFGFRHRYPIEPPRLLEAINGEYPKVVAQLNALMEIERVLKSLAEAREHEPERRWQAHYDLILAQIVAYEIQAYEYRACLQEMALKAQAGQLRPSKMSVPNKLVVEWEINHSGDYRAPKAETEKKRAEATALLKQVIDRHPNSPWADLAQDELRRGFGCRLSEWHHNPMYSERAKLVPKF